MASFLSNLPTLDQARRTGRAMPKGSSRLQAKVNAEKLTTMSDTQFKTAIRVADKMHCRKCGRQVEVRVHRLANRAEVHHAHGRRGSLRHDLRNGLLVCASCHEQLTGKVAEKWIIVPTKGSIYFTVQEKGTPRELLNTRGPIRFERVA